MTSARRLLAAFATLTATVAWALREAWAAHTRAESDELSVLMALAEQVPHVLPPRRVLAAVARLSERGQVVRGLDGYVLLTARGWARIGEPLSERDRLMLAVAREGPLPAMASPAMIYWSVADVLETERSLRRRGLIAQGRLRITAAGRAALAGVT